MQTRADVRNGALLRRDLVPPETRKQLALRLASIGLALATEFIAAVKRPVISLFSPIGSEPDPLALAIELSALGAALTLPVDWSHGTPLVYRRWNLDDPLAIGPLGIAEPADTAPELEPDVLFIPMVAFNRQGDRIGYGAGNVDRTLRFLRARKPVRVIGVAYSVQEEADIPREPHDERVDFILTENDLVSVGADAGMQRSAAHEGSRLRQIFLSPSRLTSPS